MKADPAKAQSIGSRLVSYKDSLAKHRVAVVDNAILNAILNETSLDPQAAEPEIVMAWRFYTQEREQQIACGEFRCCSSVDEINAAARFSRSREIIFDPAIAKGVASIKSLIAATIEQDIMTDAVKWQALQVQDEEQLKRLGDLWKPEQPSSLDSKQDVESRRAFAEGSLRWCKGKTETQFRRYYGHRIATAIRLMLEEHRDYWAQRPTEPYDDSALAHIFVFSIYGGNYGIGSLFGAWDLYLESRIFAHDNHIVPFGASTDEEKALNKEKRRNKPIDWPHLSPNARAIIESHIRKIIREDILADIPKWERHKIWLEEAKLRAREIRLERIQHFRDEFSSKIRDLFGGHVLEMISEEDLERYSLGIVDHQESEDDLWYSILKKYQFDGNTKSCLYFIRQGMAIKIGITDELDRRFAQIKTSAPVPCKIENVVYTHHGRILERKLHRALAPFNSHLEWFVLPARIESALFAAKSVEDIEHILGELEHASKETKLLEETD